MPIEPHPRNKRAYLAGIRHRTIIREMLILHAYRTPLGRPLSAKMVRAELAKRGIRLALSSVARHIAAVRLEDELYALEAEAG